MILNPKDYKNIATDDYCDIISQYTVQIFIDNWDKENVPKHKATGVLIFFNDSYYLVTAGHVLDWFKDKGIGALVHDRYHRIDGNYYHKFISDAKSLYEYYDIGIIKLDEYSIKFFNETSKFLDSKYISPEHIIVPKTQYLIFGYPNVKTTLIEEEMRLEVIGWKFLTMGLTESESKDIEIDKKLNNILRYDQDQIIHMKTNKLMQSPDLEGLSGCGIWYLPKILFEKGKIIHPILIGINYGHDPNKKYVFSHKMSFVYDCISKNL